MTELMVVTKKQQEKAAVEGRLAFIAGQAGGALTPEAVVEDAKDPDSPLHGYFEWDIEKAAHKHWIETARAIIRSVEVVVKTERVAVKAPFYVRDPSRPSGEAGYVAVKRIQPSHDMAVAVLEDDKQRVLDMYRRLVANALNMGLGDVMDEKLAEISAEVKSLVLAARTRRSGLRVERGAEAPRVQAGATPL